MSSEYGTYFWCFRTLKGVLLFSCCVVHTFKNLYINTSYPQFEEEPTDDDDSTKDTTDDMVWFQDYMYLVPMSFPGSTGLTLHIKHVHFFFHHRKLTPCVSSGIINLTQSGRRERSGSEFQ